MITIERIWSMPSRWTFTIKPIKKLLKQEMNGGIWIDPFAGMFSPVEITNDLNPDMPTKYHMDAVEFLKQFPANSFDGALYDPPYSPSQSKQCYENYGIYNSKYASSMLFWKRPKDELARIIKPGGKVICCGWTSQGLGKGRGFEMTRILLVPHGGTKNDTIVTVEKKINQCFNDYQ